MRWWFNVTILKILVCNRLLTCTPKIHRGNRHLLEKSFLQCSSRRTTDRVLRGPLLHTLSEKGAGRAGAAADVKAVSLKHDLEEIISQQPDNKLVEQREEGHR